MPRAVGCALVALLMAVVRIEQAGSQTATTTTASEYGGIPFVSATYQMEVIYSEMRGDVGRENACQGPFPYQYTYQVDVRQAKGSSAIGWCVKGLDCSLQTIDSVLKPATTENLLADCVFKPRTPAAAANSIPGYDPKNGIPGYDLKLECGAGLLCVENGEHVRDIKPNCSPESPCVTTSRKEPVTSRLFDSLHVPTSDPYVWGSLCRQYDYEEPATSAGGTQWLQGAWRSVNETLLFYLDINTCSCMPQCSSCEVVREGVSTVDPACIAQYPKAVCGYKILGRTGGVAVFPPSSSGMSPLVNGEPKLCFMYASIEATRVATYEEMIQKRPEFNI